MAGGALGYWWGHLCLQFFSAGSSQGRAAARRGSEATGARDSGCPQRGSLLPARKSHISLSGVAFPGSQSNRRPGTGTASSAAAVSSATGDTEPPHRRAESQDQSPSTSPAARRWLRCEAGAGSAVLAPPSRHTPPHGRPAVFLGSTKHYLPHFSWGFSSERKAAGGVGSRKMPP